MLMRPTGLPDAALVDALAAEWELPVVSLEYLTIGFGSHHWRAVDTDDRPWFVTVDDVVAKRRARDEDATTVFERLHMPPFAGAVEFLVRPVVVHEIHHAEK